MGYQDDKMGHKAYQYTPAWDRMQERSPDKLPSDSDIHTKDRGDDVICVLQVKRLGALVIRGRGLDNHGVSIFTDEEIQFD